MLRIAVIGAGRIGTIHAGNVVRQPDVRLKYVVDVDQAVAAVLAQAHGAHVADAATVFADPAVAAVIIAASTDTHAALILRAAKARTAMF